MNAKVTVKRPTDAQDASGHPTSELTTIYTDVPAAFQQDETGESTIYEADRNRYRGVLFMPPYVSINPTDVIVFGTRNLEITGINTVYDNHNIDAYIRVEWTETKP
jgi:hypothetical protein